MKISKKSFGILSSGEEVHLYILKAGDLSLSISTYGGCLCSLMVPSKGEQRDDVLLGYGTLTDYTHNDTFMGVTVGRFANRIAKSRFTVDGNSFSVYSNDGSNSLHGGRRGFDKRVWKAESLEEKGGVYLRLEYESPDGEEGYPGNLKAVVTYGLTSDNKLSCDYKAKVDAPCPINLTNHAYFNLQGEGTGTVLAHELKLYSSHYVVSDKNLIPTGEIRSVEESPFDFRKGKELGRDIKDTHPGYDHCFVVDGELGALRPCAEVYEPLSGRKMMVSTTQPGVQLYTGNFLKNIQGKGGSLYNKHEGFCLETQHYPDSPNRDEFPSSIFGPKRKYHERSVFSFDW